MGIWYTRRGNEELHVLQGIDLDIDQGDFVAFMGPSGSGKSTLLNLVVGLDVPSSGTVTVGGEEISRLSRARLTDWRARHVGFVFQPAARTLCSPQRRAAASPDAALADQAGAIAGEASAKRFGWKIGDRIPLKDSPYGPYVEFNLTGIYTGIRPQDDLTQFWFRWDYLDEKAPAQLKGTVGWYTARVAPGASMVDVGKQIDARFATSAWETRSQSEQAWTASWLEQMGNIELLLFVIGSVVFFTLLLVTGNTMAMSVRERFAEIAVLKTVGFKDRAVLLLVLFEAGAIALVGGGIGILLAKLFTLGGDPTGGFFPLFRLPADAKVAGGAIAILVGLLAGFIPALTAMRLEVVQALRRL